MEVDLACLIWLFSDRDVFFRCRFPAWVKALAVRLYSEGLSLRRVSEVLSELGFCASHGSVRLWFHKEWNTIIFLRHRSGVYSRRWDSST